MKWNIFILLASSLFYASSTLSAETNTSETEETAEDSRQEIVEEPKKETKPSYYYNSLERTTVNPAMASLVVPKGERWRVGYFPTGSFSTEIGKVDNFSDDLEELADILDDPSSTDLSSDEVVERFNIILVDVGKNGYIFSTGSFKFPVMPMFYKSSLLGGTIGIDYSFTAIGRMNVLDDELSFNDQNGTFTTSTSMYLKSGLESNFSISYSRKVYKNKHGKLYAGGKLKFIDMELSKQLIPLEELAGDNIADLIEERYDANQISSSGIGLDFGVIWDTKNYRLGLTLENINSPEFKYGEIGLDCESIAENTSARSTCEVARYFSQQQGSIKALEVHTKHALLKASATVKLSDTWVFFASADLADYNDIIGNENQWVDTFISYDSESSFLPALRLGYQVNLAGTKTSSIKFGMSLFDVISMDLEYGLDSIVVDDSSAPRRFGLSLSVQESF